MFFSFYNSGETQRYICKQLSRRNVSKIYTDSYYLKLCKLE